MKELFVEETQLGHVEVFGDEEDERAGSLRAVNDSVKLRVVDAVNLTEVKERSVFPPYPLSYNLTEGGSHGREYFNVRSGTNQGKCPFRTYEYLMFL